MKRALLTFAFAVAAGLGSTSPAWADCAVNTGTCDDGNCAVNTGTCEGWCTVNTGDCGEYGNCAVNVGGDCDSGSGGGGGGSNCPAFAVVDLLICIGDGS